jgi:hypothetical protein
MGGESQNITPTFSSRDEGSRYSKLDSYFLLHMLILYRDDTFGKAFRPTRATTARVTLPP